MFAKFWKLNTDRGSLYILKPSPSPYLCQANFCFLGKKKFGIFQLNTTYPVRLWKLLCSFSSIHCTFHWTPVYPTNIRASSAVSTLSFLAPVWYYSICVERFSSRYHNTKIEVRVTLSAWCGNTKFYLLTPWSRVLLENRTGSQLVKNFSTFYGTRMFITAFTSARQMPMSWVRLIQSITPHSTSWRSILILSSHLRQVVSFPQVFPPKTSYTPLRHTIYMSRPSHSSGFYQPNNIV